MKQIINPFLPISNFLADAEPHVFGDRVYVYGSHDRANGTTYCELPYEFFSAPVEDLGDWTSKGVNFRVEQEPLSKDTDRHQLYASDCVRGNDGRYYLYYELGGKAGVGGYHGPIGVAVSDSPDGKFEFLGHLKNPDGTPFDGGYVQFDPGVINDDGVIRIYYGTYYPFDTLPRFMRPTMNRVQCGMFNKTSSYMKEHNNDITGPVTCELADDMLTVIKGPTRIIDVHDHNSPFKTWMDVFPKDGIYMKGHGFFEASSIRKINGLYYFIYSSMVNHELCYATSKYPDRDFTYGGVIISNGDIGYKGRNAKDRVNVTGNIHGSIENINGQWYVFYHRHSHYSDYSRFLCAEKIEILEDGSIPQVEVTTSGLNGKDLSGVGKYPAGIACNLTNGRMPHNCNRQQKPKFPTIYLENDEFIIKNADKGTYARYKYFDLSKTAEIKLQVKGKGVFEVHTGLIKTDPKTINSKEVIEVSFNIKGNIHDTLEFYISKGKLDIISFELLGE